MTWLYDVTNACTAVWMLCEFGAGGLTLTVTVPLVVVRPFSERVTPAIPLVIVSEAELCATPLIVYWALVPCWASAVCSVREPDVSDTWMYFVPVSPVARLENTTVPESVAVAHT